MRFVPGLCRRYRLALTVVWACSSIGVTALGESRVADEAVVAAFDVTTASVQTLTIGRPSDDRIVTRIDVGGRTWTLELRKHDLRGADFQLLVRSDLDGPLVPVDAPPVRTYRGYVREVPTAVVAGSFRNGKLTAVIFTEADQYTVQPLSAAGLAGDDYVVYRASDQLPRGEFKCGNTDARGIAGAFPSTARREHHGGGSPSASGTGLTVADIAIQADFEFYQLNQSSISNTLLDIETVMNTVTLLYEVESIGITYEFTTVLVQTTADQPFTSTNNSTLLSQFRGAWNSPPESSIQRDIAHLFTGKEIDGNIIGTATLAVICSTSSGYGFSQSRYTFSPTNRAALTAHELGHNWSATHCNVPPPCQPDCRIMASSIGGCGTPTTFGANPTFQIVQHANSRNCLVDLASPQSTPFYDTFPQFSLDSAKWSYQSGVLVTQSGFNAPSPPLSATLGSDGSGPYAGHELRSNFILLGGEVSVPLTYHTEHRGVESGGELIVDYWSDNAVWEEIIRLVSDGTSQTNFDLHEHTLPASANHDEFRVRFRSEVDGGFWAVDDVFVGAETAPILTADPDDDAACAGDVSELAVGAVGSPPLSYQWRRDGEDVAGATETRLVIDPVDPSDAGQYTCVVTNAFGSVESGAATLTVVTDADCDDGALCNGIETCANGACQDGGNPCGDPELPFCDSEADACVACLSSGHCDDDNLCNGQETCVSGECVAGVTEMAGTPCGDDADTLCTAPDSCDGMGVCADNHAPEGEPCDDEIYCNGPETCEAGECVEGSRRCPGQQCVEGAQTCVDPAEITCRAAATVQEAGSVVLELFLTNAQEIRGYQATIEIVRTAGTGSLFADCDRSGRVFVDIFRPDFVFPQVQTATASDCFNLRFASALQAVDTVSIGSTPAYMGTYILDVSEDATIDSTFEVRVLPPEASFLSDINSQDIPFTLGPSCVITVADCVEVDFGDVAGDQGICAVNGRVDLFDIIAVLNAFAGEFAEGCELSNLDLVGNAAVCGGDGEIGLPDILAVLDAFSGITNCPNPCLTP